MNEDIRYLAMAYGAGIVLLWGYCITLWIASRRLRRRERQEQGHTP